MSQIRYAFSDKDPAELKTYSFDLSNWLAAGETPSSVQWSIAVDVGTDPGVGTMLTGTGIITGNVVSQNVQNGVDGCRYKLKAIVTTSAAQVFVCTAALPVTLKK